MLILGFGNKARQGKDTAGEAIKNFFGQDIFIVKFAAALYKECEEEHDMKGKDSVLLQYIGQLRRLENPKYWIKRAFDSIPSNTRIAVFTDMRYLNEAEEIKNEGGYTIQVSRLNPDGTQYISPDRPADHPSEVELDGYNFDAYIKSKSPQLTEFQAVACAKYFIRQKALKCTALG